MLGGHQGQVFQGHSVNLGLKRDLNNCSNLDLHLGITQSRRIFGIIFSCAVSIRNLKSAYWRMQTVIQT